MQKHILFGVFGVTPYVQIVIRDFKLPVNLCFAFFGGGGEGKVQCKLKLYEEHGAVVANQADLSVDGELDPRKTSMSAFLLFSGVLPKPGKYRVDLLVNDKVLYSSTLQINSMISNPVSELVQ